MQHHNYSLYDLENMIPWEREIYVTFLLEWLKEENDRRKKEKDEDLRKEAEKDGGLGRPTANAKEKSHAERLAENKSIDEYIEKSYINQQNKKSESNWRNLCLKILEKEGFLEGYEIQNEGQIDANIHLNLHYWQKGEPAITGLKRISKPGLRIYSKNNELPIVYGNRGIAVVSTNKGVMTGIEAKRGGVGGEVLFYVW